ncbi:conserved protein of unknown function [Tenacibaculum sp. 190524A02b]|uniref:hypothetical protein n=1 Tax=Tenacibaculum vairaonense TaxID=3137860 RepID=UPI0032B1EC26
MYIKNLNIKFYQNIAKIFYAIAKSDGVVSIEEIEILKKVVKENWLEVDETFDLFGTDTAYQIEIVFDWLLGKGTSAEDCYSDFIEYFHNHSYLFTSEIKRLIMETSSKIASSFAGKNKSELILLARLSLEFNQPTA